MHLIEKYWWKEESSIEIDQYHRDEREKQGKNRIDTTKSTLQEEISTNRFTNQSKLNVKQQMSGIDVEQMLLMRNMKRLILLIWFRSICSISYLFCHFISNVFDGHRIRWSIRQMNIFKDLCKFIQRNDIWRWFEGHQRQMSYYIERKTLITRQNLWLSSAEQWKTIEYLWSVVGFFRLIG